MNNTFSEVEVKPSVKFHWVFFAAGLMHTVFLISFAIMGLYMMVQINVISLVIYITGGIVTRKGVKQQHALKWIVAFYAEVLLHAIICTIIQGVDVSFYLYPITGMPVYGYLLFAYCDKRSLVRTSLFMAIVTFISGVFVLLFVDLVGTVYSLTGMRELSKSNIAILRGINVTFTTIMLVFFMIVFYLEVTKVLNKYLQSNKQLDFIATHDALTGLSNRHSLWKFFAELENSGDKYCIVMGDLDDFKKINDTYGHECGDRVLKGVADIILQKTDEDKDMACRWGGEEILIVMRGEREDCLARVAEIKDMISALDITQDGLKVKVSMTFGFAEGGEKGLVCDNNMDEYPDVRCTLTQHDIDNLISIVDKRLYVGKRSGKNVIIAA